MKTVFQKWLPFGVIIILLSGIFYIALQQNYRQSANDPQVQYSQGIKEYLAGGQATPEEVTGSQKVDMSASLDPFILIFDANKKLVASSGDINGTSPTPPAQVFDFNNGKENLFGLLGKLNDKRLTWQPQKGVRIAAVIAPYSKEGKAAGYILVGRSLREVENRIKMLNIIMFFGVVLTIIVSFLVFYLQGKPLSFKFLANLKRKVKENKKASGEEKRTSKK